MSVSSRYFHFFISYVGTGYGVHIYVLDTGVRKTHSEFTGRFGNGFDATTMATDPRDCDATEDDGGFGQVGTNFLPLRL